MERLSGLLRAGRTRRRNLLELLRIRLRATSDQSPRECTASSYSYEILETTDPSGTANAQTDIFHEFLHIDAPLFVQILPELQKSAI